MFLRFRCQSDSCDAPVFHDPAAATEPLAVCTLCGHKHPLHLPDSLRAESRLDECALCRGKELYTVKDFPQAVGLAVVVIAAVTSFVLLYNHTLMAFGVLVAAALLDLVIYLIAPHVTVCYRCGCRYRDLAPNTDHQTFDLATSEKYR